MNLEPVKLLFGIIITSLTTYGLVLLFDKDYLSLYIIGTLFLLGLPLNISIGILFDDQRKSINIKTVSSIFFVFALAYSLLVSVYSANIETYIIVTGVSLSLYLLIIYSIYKA